MTTKEEKSLYDKKRYAEIRANQLAEREIKEMITETDIAYLAGLIDGEGCLVITAPKLDRLQPTIQIQMTHKLVIEWVAQKFDTTIYALYRNVRKSNWKDQWTAKITGRRACNLCELMLPYLKVKNEQAKIFVEFGKTYLEQGRDERGYMKKIPKENLIQRYQLKNRMYDLNDERRGIRTFDINVVLKKIDEFYA